MKDKIIKIIKSNSDENYHITEGKLESTEHFLTDEDLNQIAKEIINEIRKSHKQFVSGNDYYFQVWPNDL